VTARTTSIRAAVAGVVLLCLPAHAADDPREVQGRAFFAKGEYQRALDLYATLFAESNDPLFLRNIGRCYQKMRVPEKAIEAFREYERRSPRLKPSEQSEIDGFIREMEDLQRAERAKAAVSPPPPPDLRAREPVAPSGGVPAGAVVSEPAPPASPPIYTRWWFWTAAAAVATGAVIAAVALGGSSTSVGNCMGLPDCVRVKN
jgi:tetratricopeptide (TPR) repeat protein